MKITGVMNTSPTTSTLHLLVLVVVPFFLVNWCSALQVNFMSDPHYDPLYGLANALGPCVAASSPVFGSPNCDSPAALITSLCADMKMQNSMYTYVAGDIQRHRFDHSGLTLNDTFDFFARSLAAVHSNGGDGTPKVVAAMGNNDMVPNYSFNTTKGSNLFLLNESEVLQRHNLLLQSEAKSFVDCAYYLRIVSSTLRVIVLQTLVWCFSLKPSIPDSETDPCGQFEFLSTQLEEAQKANSRVIIMGHIPPYMNLWGVFSAKSLRSVEEDMYWKPMYQSRYNALMKKYSATIIAQLYGHTHLFSIQALENSVPSYIIPAITPLYKNIPSYMIAQLDDSTLALKSLMQRTFSNLTWSNGIRVEDVFGNLSSTLAIRKAAQRLVTDDAMWAQYVTLRGGGEENHGLFPDGECNSWCRKLSTCSMFSESWNDIQSCINEKERNGTNVSAIILIVLGVLVIIGGCAMLIFHYKCRYNQKRSGERVNNDEPLSDVGVTVHHIYEEDFPKEDVPAHAGEELPPSEDPTAGKLGCDKK